MAIRENRIIKGGKLVNSLRKTNRLESVYNGIESNKYITAIKEGMVLAIPAIMAGSIALLLKSLPIPAYQAFISSLFNGALVNILDIINKSTMGLISLILLLTISYSYGKLIESENLTIYPTVALCSFIAFAMNRTEFFSYKIFESSWLFNAIIITLLSCVLLEKLSKIKLLKRNSYAEGADVNFNNVMRSIFPAGLVILLFALLNIILTSISKDSNFQTLLADSITSLFSDMGRTFGSSILFIFLLHIMWFFGIHGGNILDEVAKNLFEAGINVNMNLIGAGQAPTEIASKTFFDTFVLFGGCGTLLCFVVAILIGSKRSNIRGLAKLASSQVLFNINE